MGFEPPETLYKLIFEDPAMAGLEVTAREPTTGQLLTLTEVGSGDPKNAGPAQIKSAFALFAGLLDSWNVERKGVPVPADFSGVLSLSPGFITKIIDALGKAVAGVDPTSPAGSGGGGTPGTSIPMEPRSPGS
jgi:hypothetical protein